MDAGGEAGEEAVMTLPDGYSEEARVLWDAAVALNRRAGAVSLPPLLFFTDPLRTPRPWETAARLPAGAGVVFRAFGAPDAARTGRRLREATRAAGVRLLVGLDVDLAETIEADGLHLPERAADRAQAIRARRPDWILTAAWHGATTPVTVGLDALVLSPVFPAGGASSEKTALGGANFAQRVRLAERPVYALGGIDAVSALTLKSTGACGLAGVDGIQTAFGPPIRT